jgi:hypothetical protein
MGEFGDIHGPLNAGPHFDELAVGGNHLHPVIFPVADIDGVGLVNYDAVGQVELARIGHAPGSTGLQQVAAAVMGKRRLAQF